MRDHLFLFASNRFPKLDCPNCGAAKHWQRYYNAETGEVLPERYGRCDNATKCGSIYSPYIHGFDNDFKAINYIPKLQIQKINSHPIFIPKEILTDTLREYENNIFIQNLLKSVAYPFDLTDIENVISLYYLGTVPETGAICFPFIDTNGNVRAIQEKIFDRTNHTDKSIKYHTSWTHSRIQYSKYHNKPLPQWLKDYNNNESKASCYFGEHLLSRYPNNLVALVEAPKTAVIGTLYFGLPETDNDFIWLATSNLGSFTLEKSKVLRGRNVFVFPDLSKGGKTFDLWSKKAKEFEASIKGSQFIVSYLIEKYASEAGRREGNDIADSLIELDWRRFKTSKKLIQTKLDQPLSSLDKGLYRQASDYVSFEVNEWNWETETDKLFQFFKENPIPTYPIYMDEGAPANVPWAVIEKCHRDCVRFGYCEQTLDLITCAYYLKLYIKSQLTL